jgi:thiamine biosynthesis lipoprotein
MPASSLGAPFIEPTADGWRIAFVAMASPCEVLLQGGDAALAQRLADIAWHEALRIEHKFSRYREGSVLAHLHEHAGEAVEVDAETADLLDFAERCHDLSGGLFDITSGVLRAAWTFDGSDHLPDAKQVQGLLDRVGWPRLRWQRPWLKLAPGMQIDLGGIGKEYAVDRTLGLLRAQTEQPLLVNFGGDLIVSGPRLDADGQPRPWQVGIEPPAGEGATARSQTPAIVLLHGGALATSGDARRFLLKDGVRYGHVLDPHTGWPVPGAARSVTVAAPTCIEAGLLSTLALLQGPQAETFLQAQGVPYWVLG